ncbi:hypothetical protein AB0G02_18235 [Actinosynnema sp. NPDC023658]|uniref:hypothetical protein n=1 Tax=Actinosynnema sp. NPDC023658 TaxID=3155465 RepID=UPI0033E06378
MDGEMSDAAKARKDLLWGMYSDLRTHARHAETLRSNVVNFMIVVASVLIAVIGNDGNVTRKDLPLGLALLLIGPLGLMFAASYTELYERNRRRAVQVRTALDEEFLAADGPTIASLLTVADDNHETGPLYRWSRRLTGSTRRFWYILPGLVTLAGVALVIVAW